MAAVRQDVVQIGFDIDMSELTKLTGALDEIKKMLTGGIGDDAFDELAKESKKASEGVEDVKKGVEGIKPDGVNETAEGLKDTKNKAQAAHEKLKQIANTGFEKTVSGLKKLVSVLGSVALKAGKVLAKGIAVGAAGVATLVTKSVLSYADYEQLVGGVETLFKDSAGTVQRYADAAYKTAGMSSNDYMSTVTSFSASLIQSLKGNTGAAAEYANRAIIDMSDNANKMGTDMSSLQDAYQGFAKQNYTMLDNLKLGYGGTQEEMKRLIADASKMTDVQKELGITVDGTSMSFANIVNAISVMQKHMDISGTTAKEASETISGSWASLKASWSNTLTALILGGDDFDRCIDNLVDSAKTFGKNVLPAIRKSLEGVGKLITELAPMLEKELPGMIKTMLPPLIKAATSLVKGLIVALPDIVKTIAAELPTILSELWGAVKEAFGDVPALKKAEEFFGKLKTFFTENAETIKKTIPAILALVGAFKLFNKIKGLTGLFGGGKGGAGGGLFSGLAKLKPTTTLKGLGNLAIIIGGLAGLAAVLMWAAPYMAQLSDLKSIGEVLLVIGVVGLIGSALAGLAGLVGSIPIVAVLSGLGNIALVLAGFSAIAVAFGALTKVDGFTELLNDGGQVLIDICTILGEMAGSLVGGALAGISNGLPDIGTNLSDFATNASTAFEAFGSINGTGLSDFASALGTLMGVMVGDAVLSFFTGGNNYADFGQQLSDFATNASTFFTTVKDIPEESFGKMTSLFNALAGVDSLPKDGGIVGFFEGEIDFAKLAGGLKAFADQSSSLEKIGGISADAFTNLAELFNALAGVKALPNDGGVAGWFSGEVNFDKLASGLKSFASEDVIGAITAIQDIPAQGFSNITALFNALASVKDLPKEGGVLSWLSGDKTTTLTNITGALPDMATDLNSFFNTIGNRTSFRPITNLFNAISNVEIDSSAASKGLFGLGTSDLEAMGTGLGNFATNAAPFFSALGAMNGADVSTFFTDLGTAGDLPTQLAGLDGTVGTALGTLVTTATTKLGELKKTFSDDLGSIVTLMNTMAVSMQTSGAAIMEGVRLGMESKRASLITTATSIAAAISRAFAAALKINSPSKVMYELGAWTGAGQIEGMESTIPAIKSAATQMGYASMPFDTYSPDSSVNTYNSGGNVETTNVSPVFNLQISGSQDDRATARKVKRYVADAIRETFESLERKNHVLREV